MATLSLLAVPHAELFRETKLTRRCFHAWRGAAEARGRGPMLELPARPQGPHLLLRTLIVWVDVVAVQVLHGALLRRACRRRCRSALGTAMSLWSSAACRTKADAVALSCAEMVAVEAANSGSKLRCLRKWGAAAAERESLGARVGRARRALQLRRSFQAVREAGVSHAFAGSMGEGWRHRHAGRPACAYHSERLDSVRDRRRLNALFDGRDAGSGAPTSSSRL